MHQPDSSHSGVLIYAKNLDRVANFYEHVLPAHVVHADDEHRVLQSANARLIIHAIPAQFAAAIAIEIPPEVREHQAIKPFFTVANLSEAEGIALHLGGLVIGPVWPAPGLRVRNVCDPEGNIVHLRELAQ
jgi:predicted enzyme related to lactoylglutathione lyase